MYDKVKNGWNRDWETDNVPDDEPVDLSNVHMETCPICDMPKGECCHVHQRLEEGEVYSDWGSKP